jgi:hypothetical protein
MKSLNQEKERILLKKAIENIHRSGSSNYQDLMRQIGRKHRLIKLNAAQLAFVHFDPLIKDKTLIWSRGVGKTSIIAEHQDRVAHEMPRSSNNIIVPSYRKFLKEMVPALKKGLEMLGYFEGLHYFIGVKPPKSWGLPMPYMQPSDWEHIIYWYTGAIFQLISQDISGSGRALSVDSQIRDEALMLDKAKMDETSGATMRGSNVKAFEKCSLFGSTLTLSSMPITQGGKWLLSMEDKALEFPSKYYYSEFNVGVNLANLRKGYVTEAYNTALYEWLFMAEYMNERPQLIIDAYYSMLNENIHAYIPSNADWLKHEDCRYDYADDNLRPNAPLVIGVDWGSRINYMVVCQLHDTTEGRILRALNEFWALGADKEIQQDMVAKFAEYYSVFRQKRIILFFDRQGNNKTGITKETRVQMMVNQLTKLGWKIEIMSRGGANPLHSFRRLVWENILKEQDRNLVKLRINKIGCKHLLISMQNAQTKTTSKGITKNKGSERQNSTVHPTDATDPSDAVDHIAIGISNNILTNLNGRMSAMK